MKHRAIDRISGLPLFAELDRNDEVVGIENCAADVERSLPHEFGPFPNGHRRLPLYGDIPSYDAAVEVLAGPFYQVGTDRVVRTFRAHEKSARDLLREISWWFGAVHSKAEDNV
jgi:hypothetical protein